MKYLVPILLLLSSSANAGPYIDLGIGWIEDLPANGTIEVTGTGFPKLTVEEEAVISVDSPFLEIGVGYRTKNNWHFELNRFGMLDTNKESITRFRIYKRFEWQ